MIIYTQRGELSVKPIYIPDYKQSILNVTCSILQNYGVTPKHDTLPILDKLLNKKYRNIVYILVDAMGDSILEKHKNVASSLLGDRIEVISSVFPPTTTSATTSVLTGLTPIETGWIGWCQYVKKIDKTVVYFTNEDYYNPGYKFDFSVSDDVAPVTTIFEKIESINPDITTGSIFPAFREPHHHTFMKQCESVVSICNNPGEHFLYVYWDKLDTYLHEYGTESAEVKDMLASVNKGYEYLKHNLDDDSIIIMIADHSQVDVLPINIKEHPEIWSCLLRNPSIESRASTFFIKEGYQKQFVEAFNRYYGKYFVLYTRDQVLNMGLFGKGIEHESIKDVIGDYLAIAVDSYYFKLFDDNFVMKGQHAGLLYEESMVPLICNKKYE